MKIQIQIDPAQRMPDGLAAMQVGVRQLNLNWQIDIKSRQLYNQCGRPDPIGLDLLLLASTCYTLDTQVSREQSVDNWTREFEIELPVSDPDCWQAVTADLNATLAFLTGDVWQFSFRALNGHLFRPGRNWRRQSPFAANAVHLFSGGVDSLTGAVDGLARSTRSRLLLLGHYDEPGPHQSQRSLFECFPARYQKRAKLVQVRVAHGAQQSSERTMRSRSLLFLLLGVYAAHALGPEVPVYAPENGFMAINLPLTHSRVGSCSTRTMHPYFLDQLTGILQRLEIRNPIVNPYQIKTKGEAVAECADFDLLSSLIDNSVSCAHSGRRQYWNRRSAKNCGYCYPCLVRRAALYAANLDKGDKYGIDVCAGELLPDDGLESGDDLRAILGFVGRNWKANELTSEIIKVATIDQLEDHATMIARGINEIRNWLHDRGTAQLRQTLPRRSYLK